MHCNLCKASHSLTHTQNQKPYKSAMIMIIYDKWLKLQTQDYFMSSLQTNYKNDERKKMIEKAPKKYY